MRTAIALAALLLLTGCCSSKQVAVPQKKIVAKHWVTLPDDYRHSQACVIDQSGQIVGIVAERFPTQEPGRWYAWMDGKESQDWGSYTSRLLAINAADAALDGCPGYQPLEAK